MAEANLLFQAALSGIGLDVSEAVFVRSSGTFDEMTKIECFHEGVWVPASLGAIAENVKFPDGKAFTAFAVALSNQTLVAKRAAEIRHVPETGLPELWTKALQAGWKIMHCSCGCGGNYAWFKPRPSGAYESGGCVCHHEPVL